MSAHHLSTGTHYFQAVVLSLSALGGVVAEDLLFYLMEDDRLLDPVVYNAFKKTGEESLREFYKKPNCIYRYVARCFSLGNHMHIKTASANVAVTTLSYINRELVTRYEKLPLSLFSGDLNTEVRKIRDMTFEAVEDIATVKLKLILHSKVLGEEVLRKMVTVGRNSSSSIFIIEQSHGPVARYS